MKPTINPKIIDFSKLTYGNDSVLRFKEKSLNITGEKSKTAFTCDLIVEFLKAANGNFVQHKVISNALEELVDSDTNKRLLSDGNINSAFNTINRNLKKFNIVKNRIPGGVFYKYTEDRFTQLVAELHVQNEDEEKDREEIKEIKNNILENLLKTVELNNSLKKKLLFYPDEATDEILEISLKISEIELSIIKNRTNF